MHITLGANESDPTHAKKSQYPTVYSPNRVKSPKPQQNPQPTSHEKPKTTPNKATSPRELDHTTARLPEQIGAQRATGAHARKRDVHRCRAHTSTVGLPRLSKICLAFTDVIVTAISFRRSFLISKKVSLSISLEMFVFVLCLATRIGGRQPAGLFVEETVEEWGGTTWRRRISNT